MSFCGHSHRCDRVVDLKCVQSEIISIFYVSRIFSEKVWKLLQLIFHLFFSQFHMIEILFTFNILIARSPTSGFWFRCGAQLHSYGWRGLLLLLNLLRLAEQISTMSSSSIILFQWKYLKKYRILCQLVWLNIMSWLWSDVKEISTSLKLSEPPASQPFLYNHRGTHYQYEH
jgi:hypothetical protein